MDYALGIDIGGTNIKAACVDRAGELLWQRSLPTLDAGPELSPTEQRALWVEKVRALSDEARSQLGGPVALGLSIPGLASGDERSISWMMGRMEAVMGLDWTEALGSQVLVPVLNDAQAALLGEAWVGAARGLGNCILLTLGTGVGGAAMCDGHLLRGRIGRAGHLGHISLDAGGAPDIVGTPGSLEDAIGECTLLARSNGKFASTHDLVRAHLSGDGHATNVWSASVRALAVGIVSLVNVLDPQVVILGGGVARARGALFEPLQVLVDRWEWRPTGQSVQIVEAGLGDFAGAFGAAKRAFEIQHR